MIGDCRRIGCTFAKALPRTLEISLFRAAWGVGKASFESIMAFKTYTRAATPPKPGRQFLSE